MDHYSILGVPRTATADEIKQAFRRLAAEHHPDRGGDEEKFKEIQVAYSILGDQERRQAYDNPPPQFGGFNFGGGPPPDFGDMFQHFFQAGGGSPFDVFGRRQPTRNRTINLSTVITLLEAFNGKDLIADIQLPSGRTQTINVKIPAGINDGTVLRLQGLGDDEFPHLPRGDIHLTVGVQQHHEFARQGDDLVRNIDISCIDAMLGCKLTVVTLDGKTLEVNVNPGMQHDQVLSAPGYGMPNVNDNRYRGRLLMPIKIGIPVNLTPGQQELLSKFHQS
jgi:curved DNA-binding protein